MIWIINGNKLRPNHYILQLVGNGWTIKSNTCGFPVLQDFKDIEKVAIEGGYLRR